MAEDGAAPDISEDLAELSIIPPPEFTAARNERAKALRADKERERAALVAKLAKPTWTAWALNVLARDEPDVLTAFLQAGEELDDALGQGPGGDRDQVRSAQQRERAALAAATDRAAARLSGAGRTMSDQDRQRLTGTLRSAVTDPEVRDRMVRGVLDDDVESATFGFGFGFGAAEPSEVASLDAARAKRAARGGGAAGSSGVAKKKASTAKAPAATRGRAADGPGDEDAAARTEQERREAEEAEARRVEGERLAAEQTRLEEAVAGRQAELDERVAVADAADEAARTAHVAVEAARTALAAAREALDALPIGSD